MVELAEIQAAYYLVAATGVLAAAYYIFNLRNTRKTHELQAFIHAHALKFMYRNSL